LNYRKHSNQITQKNIKTNSYKIINNNNYNNTQKNYIDKCSCGQIKDKVRYNFCQRCNKIY
jgi:hypothetical protein